MPSSRSLQYRRVAPVTREDVKQMHIFDMMVNATGPAGVARTNRKPSRHAM